MASIRDYHRPATVEAALALLARSGAARSVPLGGGTVVVADRSSGPIEVVDLQALGLEGIEAGDGLVRIGATTRLHDVATSDLVPRLLRDAARREAPSTIRNAATVGGTVAAADPDSGLLAALLVLEAEVEITASSGVTTMQASELVVDRSALSGALITAVSCAEGGVTSWAATGRTPADTPIVAAYGRSVGEVTLVALTGVAATPVLVDPGRLDALDPPGDFRGSAEYRMELARVLTSRVVAALDSAG